MSPLLQVSELRLVSQQLKEDNGMLSEKNVQNISEMDNLRQQLVELTKKNERREVFPAEEKNKVTEWI